MILGATPKPRFFASNTLLTHYRLLQTSNVDRRADPLTAEVAMEPGCDLERSVVAWSAS